MKNTHVAGLVCYVKDIEKTAAFYEKLGFEKTEQTPNHLSLSLNDFWIDCEAQDKEDKPEFQQEANLEHKGAGLFLYLHVENVDQFYQELLHDGFTPSSEPRDWPWGNREFALRDPDGYKLVFFQKKLLDNISQKI